MAAAARTYPEHARQVLSLGLPLIGGQLAQFSIGMVDMIMLGWYDVTALAAVTLANSFFFVIFLVGSGFAWAAMPLVAHASEAGDDRDVRRVTRMSLWLSLIYAMIFIIPIIFSKRLLLLLGQEPEIAGLAQDYLRIAGWGLFPGLIVMVLRSYFSAMERTQVILWTTVATAVLNAMLNYALIFGNWGAPELGLKGAAIASIVIVTLSLPLLMIYAQIVLPQHALFARFWRPDWPEFRRVFKLGWPIGLTTLAETGLFSMSAVMMGWLGAIPLAAHGIATQIISATFMIHVGFSQVATVRAGRALGRVDRPGLVKGGMTVIALSGLWALVTMAGLLLMPELLISGFVDPDDVRKAEILVVGTTLLAVAAVFQLADASQILALGLLRGVQDTRTPMVIAAFSYWVVGVPASYVLGFRFDMGGVGVWLGLVLGLGLAGLLLMLRLWRRSIPMAFQTAPGSDPAPT